MIHIFQFYKKHWRIPKKFYTTETRKAFQHWETKIDSQVGYINEDKLLLPVEKKDQIQVNRTSGIFLQDIVGYNSSQSKLQIKHNSEAKKFPDWFKNQRLKLNDSQNPELAVFDIQKRKWDFEIFCIVKNNDDKFEIHLDYSANHFSIGEPKRNDHKMYVLERNQPIKISINGKSDFTMTGRKERSYGEYEYIIEYLGEVESIDFVDMNKIKVKKQLTEKFSKTIDLRKVLH
jgi:hypothetical protein